MKMPEWKTRNICSFYSYAGDRGSIVSATTTLTLIFNFISNCFKWWFEQDINYKTFQSMT